MSRFLEQSAAIVRWPWLAPLCVTLLVLLIGPPLWHWRHSRVSIAAKTVGASVRVSTRPTQIDWSQTAALRFLEVATIRDVTRGTVLARPMGEVVVSAGGAPITVAPTMVPAGTSLSIQARDDLASMSASSEPRSEDFQWRIDLSAPDSLTTTIRIASESALDLRGPSATERLPMGSALDVVLSGTAMTILASSDALVTSKADVDELTFERRTGKFGPSGNSRVVRPSLLSGLLRQLDLTGPGDRTLGIAAQAENSVFDESLAAVDIVAPRGEASLRAIYPFVNVTFVGSVRDVREGGASVTPTLPAWLLAQPVLTLIGTLASLAATLAGLVSQALKWGKK